jgi:uncharacterized membrane protein
MNAKQKGVPLAGAGWFVFATAFGYLIGSVVGNPGLGIALGAAFGLVFASVVNRKK